MNNFKNSEDMDSCNDFIPYVDESSDCSDSNDPDDEDFYDDEVVENNYDDKEEDNTTQENPMLLTQSPQTSTGNCHKGTNE